MAGATSPKAERGLISATLRTRTTLRFTLIYPAQFLPIAKRACSPPPIEKPMPSPTSVPAFHHQSQPRHWMQTFPPTVQLYQPSDPVAHTMPTRRSVGHPPCTP